MYDEKSTEYIVEDILVNDIQCSYDNFIAKLNKVANICSPKLNKNTGVKRNNSLVPWWNEKCKNAIKERNKIKKQINKEMFTRIAH